MIFEGGVAKATLGACFYNSTCRGAAITVLRQCVIALGDIFTNNSDENASGEEGGKKKKVKRKDRCAEEKKKRIDDLGYDPQKPRMPKRKTDQNQQTKDAAKAVDLNRKQRNILHKHVHDEDLGYQEILDIAKEIKAGKITF